MNETTSLTCQTQCPTACPCPILLSIASSIAHEEDALACILNAECAKINWQFKTQDARIKLARLYPVIV